MKDRPGTRRAFLEALGRAAGGATVLRAMQVLGIATAGPAGARAAAAEIDRQLAGEADATRLARAIPAGPAPGDWAGFRSAGAEVLILGAGIAGMTAAWELGKLGFRCTVLEARPSAGGRCRTLRSGDAVEELEHTRFCEFDDKPELYFNPGPARIPHHHRHLLGYCREFGVALEPFINDNRAALLHSGGAFGGQAIPARRVLADTRGHIAALLSGAIDQGALDRQLSGRDRARLSALLARFGDLDASGTYRGSTRAGLTEANSAASDPLALEALLDSGFWQSQLDFSQSLDQQPTLLQPVGGMDRIARAFESRVGASLIYEAEVVRIRRGGASATVDYRSRGELYRQRADYCICTLPATVLRRVEHDFSPAHRDEIQGFRYAQACKIAFQSPRFWERDHAIYGGISWTSQGITQLWYPSAGLGAEQGVIVGAYTFDDEVGRRFAARSPEQRLAESRRQARRLHPEFPRQVERGISVAWPNMPFQRGAWGVSRPEALLRPDRRVYFAGEHLSDLQGWQEGAVLSAYRAIGAIVARAGD